MTEIHEPIESIEVSTTASSSKLMTVTATSASGKQLTLVFSEELSRQLNTETGQCIEFWDKPAEPWTKKRKK